MKQSGPGNEKRTRHDVASVRARAVALLSCLACCAVLLAAAWWAPASSAAQAADTNTPTVTETPTSAVTPTPTYGPPQLFPSVTCGQIGNVVVVVGGVNFTPSALVQVTWSGMELGTDPSPVQVDPAGRFTFTFVVPNDYGGLHTVEASDGARQAQFSFNLGTNCPPPEPTDTPSAPTPTDTPTATPTPPTPVAEVARLFCNPDAVVPNDLVNVQGENFHPGGFFYQLRWDGVIIPWAPEGLTVGDDGRFTLWFNAPSDTYELHTLVADDGKGSTATCYVNLMPRDPTPTWTPTVTLTPTPTPSWTPGPPPGVTVTPTSTPTAGDFCAAIDATFTRGPLVNSQVDAGIKLTNTNAAWSDGQVQLGIWEYYNLAESDTGARATLAALATGQEMTAHLRFQVTHTGPTWYQVRLIDAASGQASVCGVSSWFVLYVYPSEPYPPALQEPPDAVWLDTRELTLSWLPGGIPSGAGAVDGYEVQLLDLGSGGELLRLTTGSDVTGWAHRLDADYGGRQLSWRARAHNASGWGLWATAFYFGVDTTSPEVTMSLHGTAGDNDWWRSPVVVRVGGSDPAPGSGIEATYLQIGDGRWQQVIPGGETTVDREGEYDLRAYGRDQALNRSPVIARPVKIDESLPEVEAVISQTATSSGWYTAPVTIGVEADDVVSGVATRWVRADGGEWQTDALTLGAEGEHTVEFSARDVAGNDAEVQQQDVWIDLTLPAGALALNGSLCQTCEPATVSVGVGDGASGIAHWTLSVALPQASARLGLASPLGADTVLASGSDPARDVELDGSALPAGTLVLRLTVQDVAGWVTVQELSVVNAAYQAGPTPTPWAMPTATLWPTATPDSRPYATITPSAQPPFGTPKAKKSSSHHSSGGSSGSASSSSGSTTGYSVGGTVVPVILPVTGDSYGSSLLVLPLIAAGPGLILGWTLKERCRKRGGATK
jgi:hypothetical protein